MSYRCLFSLIFIASFFFTSVLGVTNLAFAQSSPAETLSRIMANDVSAKEEFTRVIRLAQDYEDSMHQEIAALQQQIGRLNSIKGNYITKVGDDYLPINSQEVENLAALVALRMTLHSPELDSPSLGHIPALETNSQLDIALRAAMQAGYREFLVYYKEGTPPGDFVAQMVRVTLEEMTDRNYKEIENKIAKLERQIAELKQGIDSLGDVVGQAIALRNKAPDLATLSGILGTKGYYIVRLSGGGWIKGSAGYATYSSGYEYFIIWADKDRTSPVKKYYWEFPIGYDTNEQFRVWMEEKEEESRKACRDLPTLGRVTLPQIWVEGPRYEIVYGPYKGKPPENFGSRRISNGKSGSAIQWKHKSGKIADVKAVCAALGAPF